MAILWVSQLPNPWIDRLSLGYLDE